MRSGTLPTPLCVGLGEAMSHRSRRRGGGGAAARFARPPAEQDQRAASWRSTSTATWSSVFPASYDSFAYVEGEGLMMGIKDLAVSSGSACTSASLERRTCCALGVEEELAHTSLRLGLGRFTTEAEIRRRPHRRRGAAAEEHEPAWEMAQEGDRP